MKKHETNLKMSFLSSNIKYLRKKSELSQAEFGQIFGASRGMIDTYETRRSQPTYETIRKIADYFKVSLDDLTDKDLSLGYPMRIVEEKNEGVKDELIKILQKQIESLQSTVEHQQAIIDKLLHNKQGK